MLQSLEKIAYNEPHNSNNFTYERLDPLQPFRV